MASCHWQPWIQPEFPKKNWSAAAVSKSFKDQKRPAQKVTHTVGNNINWINLLPPKGEKFMTKMPVNIEKKKFFWERVWKISEILRGIPWAYWKFRTIIISTDYYIRFSKFILKFSRGKNWDLYLLLGLFKPLGHCLKYFTLRRGWPTVLV